MADNGFGKKIEDFGQNVWKKAQSAVDIVSLNNDIGTKSRELEAIYTEIGRSYCTEQAEAAKAAYPERFDEAARLFSEIDALEEKVRRRKGVKKCPRCGEQVVLSAAFCPKCGSEVPTPEPEPEPEAECKAEPVVETDATFCASCGASLSEGDVFCPRCGKARA